MGYRKKSRMGFTLIELLVVIAIIALLMAILTPAMERAKEMARQVVCGSGQKGLGQTAFSFAAEREALPRAFHYYGWAGGVDYNGTPPTGTPGACFGYFINDVSEDDGNGDWKFYGTPWDTWIRYGFMPKQAICPSQRWLKQLMEKWFGYGEVEWDQIVFLDDSVQKPFSGANVAWRRWTRMSTAYFGGADKLGNTLNIQRNDRARQFTPARTEMDKNAASKVLAMDMTWYDEGGQWSDPLGMPRTRINHKKKGNSDEVDAANILYGDGHVERLNGSQIGGDLTEDTADKWTFCAGSYGNGPYYFW